MSDDAFPILSARDLPATKAFYERLGFVQTYQFPPDGEPGYVGMQRGADHLGIGAASDDDRFSYWVYVDDVDAAFEALRDAGAPVVADPADQPWGERIARLRDPDGTMLILGSRPN